MRLIDADALGVGRCSRDVLPADYCAGWNGLIALIEQTPTVDAVEVVRCKDCTHYEYPNTCHCHKADENSTPIFVHDDDFCSYGERKEK